MDNIFERDQSGYADGFVEGYYAHRRRGHVMLPVRVWWGPPDGLDRSPRWQISVAGVILDDETAGRALARREDVWPRCQEQPISEAEFRYLQARIDHAREHSPTDPYGDHRGKVDLLNAKDPF